MAETIQAVTDRSFEKEVLEAEGPVLVDFWAEWCGPCRLVAPTVEALAHDYRGQLRVAKLNVDENLATTARYGVRGIPTLLLFKGGEVKDQIVGNHPRAHIEKVIQKHLS